MKKLIILSLAFLCGLNGLKAQDPAPDLKLMKARYLVSENEFDSALQVLKEVSQAPSNLSAYSEAMGRCLMKTGRSDEAVQWFTRLAETDPASGYIWLARNAMNRNQPEEAIRYLEKHLARPDHLEARLIKMDKAFASLENNRSWIRLWQTGWYSKAEEWTGEAEYMLTSGNPDEAGALVDSILAADPGQASAWFLKSRIEAAGAQKRQAGESLQQSLKYGSEQPRLLEKILQYCLAAGDYPKVNDIASRLIRLDPGNPDYRIYRTLSRIVEGTESLAIRELEALNEAGITPAELYYQAGLRLAETNPRQSEQYLSQAINQGKMDARYYYQRGKIRCSLGMTENGLSDMAMSLDINPDQPGLWYERGMIRFEAGDTDGACHDWQKALEMGNPKAPDELYKHCK